MMQLVYSRLKDGKTYHGITLKNFNDSMLSLARGKLWQFSSNLMRDRLEWTDVEML